VLSGFRACGIYPYDPSKVKARDDPVSDPGGAAADGDHASNGTPDRKKPAIAPEIEPGTPEADELIEKAIQKLQGSRPVRKYARLGGSRIISADSYLIAQAQKMFANEVGVSAKKKKHRHLQLLHLPDLRMMMMPIPS
jgi:hypothetical protein